MLTALCYPVSSYAVETVTGAVPNMNATTPTNTDNSETHTNQVTLSKNQSAIMLNQSMLAQNQAAMNTNNQNGLQNAISETQMESLLLDPDVTEKGFDNLVEQLSLYLVIIMTFQRLLLLTRRSPRFSLLDTVTP